MQFLATAEQMQNFDRAAIHDAGIPALVLMENAGRAFVDELAAEAGFPLAGKRVLILCGGGNNGGDGFVIARQLVNRRCNVHVALLTVPSKIRGEARITLDAVMKLKKIRGIDLRVSRVRSERDLARLDKPEIIVDAIFGTGFSGEVRGHFRDAITWMNNQKAFVASVDISSGVDATNGAVKVVAVRAGLTVTMGSAKIGQYVGAGCDYSGKVYVADISIPAAIMRPPRDSAFRITADDVRELLPHRPRTAHKYNVGKVFVIGGSRQFTGAPLMTASAALRCGAGAVVLGIPRSVHDVVARRVEELLLAPLEETAQGALGLNAMEAILERSAWADVVAIGPGLSRDEETMALVREAIHRIERPMVIDADALSALAGSYTLLKHRKAETALTPHTGEFSKLTGLPSEAIEADRVAAARSAARRARAVIVLKGSPTVTARPDGSVLVNSTGNPGMATIGSGDVLTGIIASLIAQGMKTADAAMSGVFLHGMAGDIAAAHLGVRSLLATDIEQSLPEAFVTVER